MKQLYNALFLFVVVLLVTAVLYALIVGLHAIGCPEWLRILIIAGASLGVYTGLGEFIAKNRPPRK